MDQVIRDCTARFKLRQLPLFFLLSAALFAQRVPLNDTSGSYMEFAGGLYENRSNAIPADHRQVGNARAALVRPLDRNGAPNESGKIVFLSIGISNAAQEWCNASVQTACGRETFMSQTAADARVNHSALVILNGAAGGQVAETWDSPEEANYDRVASAVLTPFGVTEHQVQVVWLKVANPNPAISLPSASADAYRLQSHLGNILRALKVRYRNLQQVFVASRTYAGYANTSLNPEPYAYETGWAVKWLIQAQITQMRTGAVDSRSGSLDYNSVAPWVGWGPYLWANGTSPNPDGLSWSAEDFRSDGTHPSTAGAQKVTARLVDFFLNSGSTPWFRIAPPALTPPLPPSTPPSNLPAPPPEPN